MGKDCVNSFSSECSKRKIKRMGWPMAKQDKKSLHLAIQHSFELGTNCRPFVFPEPHCISLKNCVMTYERCENIAINCNTCKFVARSLRSLEEPTLENGMMFKAYLERFILGIVEKCYARHICSIQDQRRINCDALGVVDES